MIDVQAIFFPPVIFLSMVGIGIELQWQQFRALAAAPRIPLLAGILLIAARWVGMSQIDAATVAIEGSIRNLAIAFLIATNVPGRIDIAVLPSVYFAAVLIIGFGFAHYFRRTQRSGL